MATLLKFDHSASAAHTGTQRFCSRCGEAGAPPPPRGRPLRERRVCEACGMGVLLSCAREALPGMGAAFIIATADLSVSAVSSAGEMLFGLEEDLLGVPLVSLMKATGGKERLARTVATAALRNRPPTVLTMRGLTPNAEAAGLLAARISTCQPPRGALITVGPANLSSI